jgi:hypothetical protein
MDRADAGEKDAQKIMDLGDRGHGRAGILCGRLLLNGDGRGDPFDQVGVGFVHALQELAGVGGERFDVATLAFGVKGIEGERGFARAADPGDDDELVERNVEVDVFQVVDPHAAEADSLVHGSPNTIPHYSAFI